MVVEDKIQEAKECFKTVSKKGYNTYQKFKYIESEDLFPVVRDVCRKFNLRTSFSWNYEHSRIELTVTDKEDKSSYTACVPVPLLSASDAGKYMQDVGRIQTYAMRYLYVQVFEIAVPDNIDNQNQKPHKMLEKTGKNQKTNLQKRNNIQKNTSKTVNVTQERVKEILDTAYERVVIEANKEFTINNALWTIKRLCKNEDELEACKKALECPMEGNEA